MNLPPSVHVLRAIQMPASVTSGGALARSFAPQTSNRTRHQRKWRWPILTKLQIVTARDRAGSRLDERIRAGIYLTCGGMPLRRQFDLGRSRNASRSSKSRTRTMKVTTPRPEQPFNLHDPTCQHLVAASLNVGRLRQAANRSGATKGICDGIDTSINHTLRDIHGRQRAIIKV